jgi:hypothetical protein
MSYETEEVFGRLDDDWSVMGIFLAPADWSIGSDYKSK